MMPARLGELTRGGIRLSSSDRAQLTTFWYDDEDWVVRYLSVRRGDGWFLIPTPLIGIDERYQLLLADRTRQLFPLPSTTLGGPSRGPGEISRTDERRLLAWYQLRPYWGGDGLWGDSLEPSAIVEPDDSTSGVGIHRGDETSGTGVFAADDLLHDTVACPDGAYGWVEDLLLDLDRWSVRYLIVRALPAYRVERNASPLSVDQQADALISPYWGTWYRADDQIRVPFTRATIWASPAYKPDTLSPGDERILARHFGFVRNW